MAGGTKVKQEKTTPSTVTEIEATFSFDSSFESSVFSDLQDAPPLSATTQSTGSSFVVEAEWNPVEFDLKKFSNPKWKKRKDNKPRRIQDIRLERLDSSSGEEGGATAAAAAAANPEQNVGGDSDHYIWPYDDPGSPCALFGRKTIMSSNPAEGFEGEFSSGDPEWNNHHSERQQSRIRAHKKSSSKRFLQAQQQQHQEEDDDGSAGSYDLEAASQSGSEFEEDEDYTDDESDHSVTDSPTIDDDALMITPAMGKTREARKKPPTLKRGAHGVATPSVVKAMKDKRAFTSDDEDDNGSIDFDAEFDSDLDSAGSGHSKKGRGRGDNGTRSKREGRLEAANASFRRASASKKKDKFEFDRSMSSADLRAARRANNSFKGKMEMNKSYSVLESKRRAQRTNSRRQERMQNSFSSSSGTNLHASSRKMSASSHSKSPPPGKASSTRKIPSRAKSLGNPTAGTSKLKSALSKFSGSTDEPPSAQGAGKKSYGSTLSALKALSGADAADGGGESDLKSAIMQQVYRSSSMNPIELKRKPKPKMSKATSLSASGMARAAVASGEIFSKDGSAPGGRVRRSKTTTDKGSSLSDFSASYHESIAKMRKQKMADASDRSAMSGTSAASARSSDHQRKERPINLDRRAKSFSNSRSNNMDLQEAEAAELSPKPRMRRGSSKGDLESMGHSSKRNLQKSPRRVQKERTYDASPQRPSGPSVIALLKKQEPVTDSEMMQKGNRQMFHALMYKTRMGIDMDQLRQTVEKGGENGSASDASK